MRKQKQTQSNPLSQFQRERGRQAIRTFALCLYAERYTLDAVPKTNPIFSRPNMRYQYQNRGNGGQKVR
jgi:hypothetical protein